MKNPLCCDECTKRPTCTVHSEDWKPTCCSGFVNRRDEGYYYVTASLRYKFYRYCTRYEHPVLHIIGVILRKLLWFCIIGLLVWGIGTELRF